MVAAGGLAFAVAAVAIGGPEVESLRRFVAERFRQRRPRDTACRVRGGGAVPNPAGRGMPRPYGGSLLAASHNASSSSGVAPWSVAPARRERILHVPEAGARSGRRRPSARLRRSEGAGGGPATSPRRADRRAPPRRAARSPLCHRRLELVELLAQLWPSRPACRSSRSPRAPPLAQTLRAQEGRHRARHSRQRREHRPCPWRSADLIRDQLRSTSSAPLTLVSPNTCGWRRTIFSLDRTDDVGDA